MSTPLSTTLTLPILTVQPDFPAVVNDVRAGTVPSEAFWLSCYKLGEPSVHARVQATLDEDDRELVRLSPDTGGVDITQNDTRLDARVVEWTARCAALGIRETEVILPRQKYAYADQVDARKHPSLLALATAPTLTHYATGHADGSVSLHAASRTPASPFPQFHFELTPRSYAHAKPHLSSVTSVRFFPSARVLLTASVDFTLSILPAEPPPSPLGDAQRLAPARILKGHSRAVTSTAIVSRGRNVLSGARDGSVRLWDVSTGESIRAYTAEDFPPVEAISLGTRPAVTGGVANGHAQVHGANGVNGASTASTDEREVDTADKVVFAAHGDGSLTAYDLRSPTTVLRLRSSQPSSASLQAVAYDADRVQVATGDAQGVVRVWDIRSLTEGQEVGAVRRNQSAITALAWLSTPDDVNAEAELVVGTADGLPYVLGVGGSGGVSPWRVKGELVGVDCEPVRGVEVVGREVWTAAGDGAVRRYVL